jgi:Protein of unknown function (DUF1553)/Protein of unknown function (DUF1549)/Planctomycete cytochrome C
MHALRTQSRSFAWFWILFCGSFWLIQSSVAHAAEPLSFNRDIRPILSDKCFACHGFDSKKREANLRLDTPEGAYAEHEGVKAVVPKDLNASALWKRINSTDEAEIMPPPESHKKLSDAEKQTLKLWIEQGAPYQKHWAFEAPVAVPFPELPDLAKEANPIDRWIIARLRSQGLKPSPMADKETLIRRVAFATTGLPPTVAEVDAFLADTSAEAYENMVDRYLASPHYGEEMARHWLDVARYADTHGLHLDNERQMWAYRDWVVNAFNRNLPFDQFTREQLAGDLLPNPTMEQLIATGFNRCNVTTSEGGSINAEYIFRYAVDRASTTAETWLGLTAGCAVCHDHKFDPITQKEFYSMYAFFNSAADPAMDGNALLTQPVLKMETPEVKTELAKINGQITEKQKLLDEAATNATQEYVDPATLVPKPAVAENETIWLDDDFPANAQVHSGPGQPTLFITAEQGPVHSGKRALKRQDAGLSQDYYEGGATPLEIPSQATLIAHVYLDAKNPPKSIMLQYHKGGWKHRAVWGDYDVIPWGAANTHERVNMGALPAVGQWVKLEIPADKVGLNGGDKITGLACTQFGGIVYWDKVGIVGRSDPASDPARSFRAWWKLATGKDTPGIAPDLNEIAKRGPEKESKPEEEKRLLAYYVQSVCGETKPRFTSFVEELNKLKQSREAVDKSIPSTFVYKDLPQPRESFVMMRGAYDKPGDKVEPSVPEIFPRMKLADEKARPSRLDLANWLVAPEHPLTARVTVNRFWQQLFGTGLVKTSYDFGSQGEMPSHPELLDHLAITFQKEGWNMKQFMRLLLNSATFKQSSRVTAELVARDPENRLYARGPRFRLDAEQIRDNALFVSGLAKLEMGGKGVKPYQPGNIWEPVGFAGSNTRFYKQDEGNALYRRSIYVFLKRTAPPPFMANFDAPNREQFCTKRERSNTPLQALQLMNDVQHVEAARAFAERILKEGGATPAQRIQYAYRNLLSRLPEAEEVALLEAQLKAHLERYQKDEAAAKKLISLGQSKPSGVANPAETAAYTLLANTLFNLDETVNRN